MAKITFTKGVDSLAFTYNNQFPVSRPVEKFQVVDRTADGTLQVEDLGVDVERRELVFKFMPQADYDALVTWFNTTCNGAAETFTFTDERSNGMTVRMLTTVLDFRETQWQQYEGTLELEVIS